MYPPQDEKKQIDVNSIASENDEFNFDSSINDLKWYSNPQNWVRIVIAIVLTSFIIFALCHPTFSVDLLTFFLEWIENNPWDGSIAFVIAYIICNILMIPGIILSLGAGIIYTRSIGFWVGIGYASIIITISCFFGSCLAFLNARFLLRKALVYLIRNHSKFKLIDRAVNKHGFKVVFLFRLSPVTPYSLFNYVMGFSSVSFTDYCFGSIGMLPNIFAYVYLGASIHNIYQISTVNPENSEYMLTITIIGVVVLIITILYFAWMARNELRRIAKEIRRENMNNLTSDIENTPLTLDDEYNSNDDLL
eukprot:540508_1